MVPQDLVPAVRALANAVVSAAVRTVEESGKNISCKKGCGACCRQLVPISGAEAREIRDLVANLPEPRRSEIRRRFSEARERLEQSGLLGKLLDRQQWMDEEVQPLGVEYFRLGIPCPFLEDESCSIHLDRPVSCREYLVTSPAENCATASAEAIKQVKIPFKLWTALARLDRGDSPSRFIQWVPLVLAPEWADQHPTQPAPRPGMELLRDLFEQISSPTE
jgi:Fe-S-cluster containining protein